MNEAGMDREGAIIGEGVNASEDRVPLGQSG